jgi:hypothetical protein
MITQAFILGREMKGVGELKVEGLNADPNKKTAPDLSETAPPSKIKTLIH